jgi:DNA-binding NarL/FixJ family response regulator
MKTRVLIADDHGVVAEALRHLVDAQADMEVVACAADGREAVRTALKIAPDVLLMDNAMPVLNGIEATRLLREERPDARVIMLSMYSDPVHVCRALQAGAMGYVLKKSVAKDVTEAIRAVHGGRRFLSAPLVDSVIDRFVSKDASDDPLLRLSPRERQVLQMVAEGHALADIALALSLSPKTVETYRARMMEKLGLRGLAALIRFAIRHGVTSTE